jgi:sugar phosphate isomerase/epimerase
MHFGIGQVVLNKLGPAASLKKLKELGFERVEIHSRYLDARFTGDDAFNEMAATLDQTGLVAAQAHLPFWSGIDVGNYNETIRNYGMSITRQAVERCARLGRPMLVLHPGTWQGTADEFLLGLFRELVVRAVRELADFAAAHDMVICVENMLANGPGDGRRRFGASTADLVEICSAVPGSRACLDTGHAFYNGEDPAASVTALSAAGLLAALHVQDTDGFPHDRHWLPGRGRIDWPTFVAALRQVGYAGTFMLEVSSAGDEGEAHAREALELPRRLGIA